MFVSYNLVRYPLKFRSATRRDRSAVSALHEYSGRRSSKTSDRRPGTGQAGDQASVQPFPNRLPAKSFDEPF